MKKIFNAFLTLAMVVTAGMTLVSCSVNDNPSVPQNSALAQQLVGEWIDEYDYDGTGDILITTIYHFYDDGTCWKELNYVEDSKVDDIFVSRYATDQSTYTIDASGRVVMTVKNVETDTEETEELTFDGTHLSVTYAIEPITLIRATDAQIQFYQAEADAWHGGSDDSGEVAVSHPLSESVLGEIVGTDGQAYALADRHNLPSGVSAAAMVAYKDGANGLAIALTDENGRKNWRTANGANGAAAHKPTVSGQTWRLPSLDEWKQMIKANGGSEDVYLPLKYAVMRAEGGFFENGYYWTSTEYETKKGYANYVDFYSSRARFGGFAINAFCYVRACFAF